MEEYEAWPAYPAEVPPRHQRKTQVWERNGAFDDNLNFFCIPKSFRAPVAQHFGSDPEVTHYMSGWHGGVEGHSNIGGTHSLASICTRSLFGLLSDSIDVKPEANSLPKTT